MLWTAVKNSNDSRAVCLLLFSQNIYIYFFFSGIETIFSGFEMKQVPLTPCLHHYVTFWLKPISCRKLALLVSKLRSQMIAVAELVLAAFEQHRWDTRPIPRSTSQSFP